MVNTCLSFSGAAAGFKFPVCASQRNSLRCYFSTEFRNNIIEYIIALCMLHWEGGISQSSPLKLQPPWGTCCADERVWEVGATDLRSEYFCLVTWCGSKKETLCHSLTWGTSHLRHFFFPQSHHSLYRVHLGGISEHLIYPESVPWYLHRVFEEECKTSDHHFSMPAMKFWTHPCYGEVHPCEISEM